MAASRNARRRRVVGLIPRIVQGLLACMRWSIQHPQPALLVLVTVAALWAFSTYVRHTDAFRITRVILPENSSFHFREPLVGENLWAVDINALADDLKSQQPWLKNVRVIRDLPSTIRIEATERNPVAQVHFRLWHPVDGEGFILPKGSPQPLEELTRLSGLEALRSSLVVGTVNQEPRLSAGLRVIEALARHPTLASYRVTDLNMAEPNQIRFVIDGTTEIRCGSEAELLDQLDRLQRALSIAAKRGVVARYVDIRFPEPVIAPRG